MHKNTIFYQLLLFSPLLSLAGLTGILFSSRSDVAYSAMRIWQGVGFTIGFVIAELLSFHHRVWVLLATVSVAAVVNVILEFTTQSKEELLPCVYRRRHRKSCDNSEPSSVEGSNTSSPNLDIKKEPAMDDGELARRDRVTNVNCSVGQNPMFIMYGGRRPSTMSTWSADSLDGTLPSNSTDYATLAPTVNNGGDGMLLLQQSGQNPLFVMYNGRRPSTESINSYKLSERGDRRPSGVSAIYAADSLDGTLPQIASSDSNPPPPHCETTTPCTNYPPLVVTTVPYMGSDAPVRVLSPIHECEDDDSEGENPAITKDSRMSSGTIQRTNSYMAALDDAVSMEYSHC